MVASPRVARSTHPKGDDAINIVPGIEDRLDALPPGCRAGGYPMLIGIDGLPTHFDNLTTVYPGMWAGSVGPHCIRSCRPCVPAEMRVFQLAASTAPEATRSLRQIDHLIREATS